MYETKLSTKIADQSLETLFRWRDSDQARVDKLAAIYASPKTPVRDMRPPAPGPAGREALVETLESSPVAASVDPSRPST
jgi:hypothetical protein